MVETTLDNINKLHVNGKLKETFDAYQSFLFKFPQNVVALSGRARVLKDMGDFKEALDAYNSIIRDFPEDVTARIGRAELLKDMGDHKEALNAYNSIIKDFPEDVVARTGRAELLKDMGRFEEAEVIKLKLHFPPIEINEAEKEWLNEIYKAYKANKKIAEPQRT